MCVSSRLCWYTSVRDLIALPMLYMGVVRGGIGGGYSRHAGVLDIVVGDQ
jgi:hypothetical protein